MKSQPAKPTERTAFHPTAWLMWIGAAALPAMLTRNPLYLILIGVAVGMVYAGLPGRRSPLAASWLGLVKLGAFLTLFAVPMNALTVHSGRLVLFTLPATWPVIGGPITGEAVLFGLSTSISLTVILLIFATLNVALDQSTLLRLAPPFLVEAGVIVAIAVGFIPQMVRSFHDIREAQTLRGHRFDGGRLDGLRQLAPLFVALLTTGLERSITLAESMESRGFGGNRAEIPAGHKLWGQAAVLTSMGGLAVGLFLAQYRPAWAPGAWTLIALSVGGLAVILWRQGQQAQRSSYNRQIWRQRDSWLAASAALILGLTVLGRLWQPDLFVYYPYPPGSPWPDFNLAVGASLLLISAPVWLLPGRTAPAHRTVIDERMASATAPSLGMD
ncbi:MAG: energy-coupling factor transporter transmembrane protein EcfT [Caldilineaceae bacterium]|nr:energy-coupling factor transporter transmembrane protein EcfT [Caldilineaceae bacterium]MBP8106745.1 energy-coupling factor transporter transmembrane protein EcfT [Caldilineaceae bacterium]MBP8123384.1 energy-coupling factor transporter transmembrane protein EcfT [Caldilineaceae bacterium]MBP9073427.1 energy-coupling factor transporter transmembrane protein EcfT [Caldilineaceae bacterium]